HAVDAADAEFVELGRSAGDAAEDAVSTRVRVCPAENGGGGPRTEGEAGELAHEVLAADSFPAEAFDGVVLDVIGVFAVDDHRVFDLPGVDQLRGEAHPVDEPEACVGDVEVDRGRRQPETVVQLHRDRGLEVLAGYGRVDEEPDPVRRNSGGGEGPVPGVDRSTVERLGLVPVAAFVHAGDALEQSGGKLEPLQNRVQPGVDLLRGGDAGGEGGRDRQQRDVAMRGRCVSIQWELPVDV